MVKIEPNEWGKYPCPYCDRILTVVVREWMDPPQMDYVCHKCKKILVTAKKSSLDNFVYK